MAHLKKEDQDIEQNKTKKDPAAAGNPGSSEIEQDPAAAKNPDLVENSAGDISQEQADAMVARIQNRVKETEQINKKPDEDLIDTKFVMECLGRNELGDAELFKKLYRDDFLFNKSMDGWMAWAGHHWILDKMDYAWASVDGVASVYENEAKKLYKKIIKLKPEDSANPIKKQKALNKRASTLRSRARSRNCVLFSHTSKDPLAIDGTEIDQSPMQLACANGVINLRTGELEPGRQGDHLLKASPVKFPKEGIKADASKWEKVLMEIFSGNQIMVDFFQQLCGYALVGEVSESILVVMTGRGRNGKSLIVETISKILGPLAGPIRSEMLLDQNRIANSAGPSPDIMSLRGLRMAFASETDDGCRISPSRVKWLTGNDSIVGRNPHDKYDVNFLPSHTLFLLTNHKPHAPADDYAFWQRVVLIPFDLSFVDRDPENETERRSNPQLAKELEKIQPEILAWMVAGCLKWQKAGRLNRPDIVNEAVNKYQQEEDSVGDFLDECCVVGDKLKVKATELYGCFEPWWKHNVSNFVPKQKRFGKWMGKRFLKKKSGVYWYLGVGLVADSDDDNGFKKMVQGKPDHQAKGK